jgi:hypothetical protein
LFILDDCLGHWKILPLILDDWLDECEDALQTCRAGAIAAKTGEPPPFFCDPTWCLECWCREAGVCSPPLDFTPDKFVELHAASIAADIATIELRKDSRIEYEACDKRVKETMKRYGQGKYIAGDWLITVKEQKNGIRTTWKPLGGNGDENRIR